MKHSLKPLIAALAVTLTLAACGDKAEKKVATQVAAKVGKEEISVHQINQVLSRTNAANATPAAVDKLRREVLEKLIDQQLAVDQAMETKINRSPEVVAMLESARREVLARAYIQQITGALPKPSPEELKKYYTDHPALFCRTARVFNLQEVQLPAAAGEATAEDRARHADGGQAHGRGGQLPQGPRHQVRWWCSHPGSRTDSPRAADQGACA